MKSEEKLKQILDKWWNTEPFGFDHPETYKGILKLMKKSRKQALEEVIEILKLQSERFKPVTNNQTYAIDCVFSNLIHQIKKLSEEKE